MTTVLPPGEPQPLTGASRPFLALRSSGLLWLINRVVFHPRGLALVLLTDEHGTPTGWDLVGDGTQPYRFDDEDDQAAFTAASRTLAAATGAPPAPPPTPEELATAAVEPALTSLRAMRTAAAQVFRRDDPHGDRA